MRARAIVAIVALTIVASEREARALAFTFDTLPPDGILTADAGATTGWGYTITNTSATLWLLLTNIAHDPVANGVMDTSIFDFPLLAPNASITTPYDETIPLGLAAFTWGPSAPDGFVNTGVFSLLGEFYTDDPFLSGGQFVGDADEATASFEVRARAQAPEPGPVLLLVVAAGAYAACRRRIGIQ